MAAAKIIHTDSGTTVTMSSGDWHSEFRRDSDGSTFLVQRAYDGSVVQRHPVSADAFREALVVAQQFAAAENLITRTIKSTWSIGRN